MTAFDFLLCCVFSLQNDLMEWLHLWSSWYQVQCGAPSYAPSQQLDAGSDDAEEEEEEVMSSDYDSCSEEELSSEDEYEESGRAKKQKTKRKKKRTGGHIDGVSNVLLLEGISILNKNLPFNCSLDSCMNIYVCCRPDGIL
jgi:hypothetical protein